MNGKELLEQGLRSGIPLWRIEDELDWRENQGPRWSEDGVRKQHDPVCRSVHDVSSLRQTVNLLFGWFFNRKTKPILPEVSLKSKPM